MSHAIGKIRNPAAPLFLPLVTLGVYGFVWIYKLFKEAGAYTNSRNGVHVTSPGLAVGLLFVPVFNIIWAVMLVFKIPGLVTKMRRADEVPENLIGANGSLGFLCFIPILGNILWVILTQSSINSFWRHVTYLRSTLNSKVGPERESDTYKKCPHCAEFIKSEALKCRYCHENVGNDK